MGELRVRKGEVGVAMYAAPRPQVLDVALHRAVQEKSTGPQALREDDDWRLCRQVAVVKDGRTQGWGGQAFLATRGKA